MALIGMTHWNPTGESMWSIIRRVAIQNHLSWLEVRRWFGTKDLNSFGGPNCPSFDDHKHFNLVGFAKVAGWDAEWLRSSFSDWYSPPWSNSNHDAGNGLVQSALRVCRLCAVSGTHMIVHQLRNWHKCPVHDEPIVDRCPNCDSRLGYYKVRKDFWKESNCRSCDTQLFGARAPLECDQEHRIAFVRDYADWITSLESACVAGSDRFTWLNTPESSRHLALARLVRPAPKWTECLHGPHEAKLESWTWEGPPLDPGTTARAHRIPTDPVRLMYGHHYRRIQRPRIVEDFARFLAVGVRNQHVELRDKFGQHPGHAGIYEVNSKECAAQWGEGVDCWHSALWFWRRCMDEAFPWRSRVARVREHQPIYMGVVWDSWVQTIGSLIWSPFRNLKHARNAEFVRWLTRLWLHRFLTESYCLFVGISCRMIGGPWMNSHWLMSALDRVGRDSMWVLEHDSGTTQAHVLSTVADIGQFEALLASGFKGSNADFCESFERLQPLIGLLSPGTLEVKEWRSHWQTVRDYHDEK